MLDIKIRRLKKIDLTVLQVLPRNSNQKYNKKLYNQ